MKPKYLLLIPLLCLSFISKAQLTADFPDSNFRWNTHDSHTLFEDLDGTEIDGSYYDTGDTVIKNVHYRKVNFKYTYFGRWTMFGPLGYFHGDKLYCLLRNDKINKKVYSIPQHISLYSVNGIPDTTETLLYDFNLKVGDIYPITVDNPTLDTSLYIYAIDTITDWFNIKRAVYQTSHYAGSEYYNLIQGIGGGIGLENGLEKYEDHIRQNNLECFKNDTLEISIENNFLSSIQFWPTSCNNHIYLSVNNPKLYQIQISPNPVTSSFTIDIPDEEATFTLINTLGQSQEILGVREGTTWNFNASTIENGIYFITILTDKNQYSSRFIKIN